ncbi:hypothetical protein SARC_15060, partial [Sphaeroforma arctica JP610]
WSIEFIILESRGDIEVVDLIVMECAYGCESTDSSSSGGRSICIRIAVAILLFVAASHHASFISSQTAVFVMSDRKNTFTVNNFSRVGSFRDRDCGSQFLTNVILSFGLDSIFPVGPVSMDLIVPSRPIGMPSIRDAERKIVLSGDVASMYSEGWMGEDQGIPLKVVKCGM